METRLSEENKEFMMDLLAVLRKQIQMDYEDMALIMMQINTEEKLEQFKAWLRTKLEDGKFQTTPIEVMNMTAQIGKITIQE